MQALPIPQKAPLGCRFGISTRKPHTLPHQRSGDAGLKILLVHTFFQQFGGQDSVVLSEREMLERRGHEVVFYSRRNDDIKEYGAADKVRFLTDTIYSRRTVRDLHVLVSGNRPDLAYVHNIYPLISPSLYHALHSMGIPVVQCVHDFRPLCSNGLFYTEGQSCERCKGGNYLHGVVHRCYRDSYFVSGLYALTLGLNRFANMLDKISAFICLNEFHRTKFLEAGVPNSKLFVRPNSIDAMPVMLGPAPEARQYAVYFGRLSPEKGLLTLLQAFERAAPARLKIAGSGAMEAELKQYIRDKKLDNVELVGFLEGAEKARLLSGALFAVIPSECHENFPVVSLECFAAGKPILASRMGGLPSIVSEGETGLLFTAGNAGEIAERVRYMFSHPLDADRMGRRAREIVETKYSRERSYQELLDIFQKVLVA
jgi:glycosyltransferase involved in cell wall biosynthesis